MYNIVLIEKGTESISFIENLSRDPVAIFTCLLAILTGISLIFTYLMVKETKRASKLTSEALAFFKKTERPWIGCRKSSFVIFKTKNKSGKILSDPEYIEKGTFSLTISNGGKTSAVGCNINITYKVIDEEQESSKPEHLNSANEVPLKDIVINPGNFHIDNILYISQKDLEDMNYQEIAKRKSLMVNVGISYKDVLDNEYVTRLLIKVKKIDEEYRIFYLNSKE